jgi:hypothetical protein
MVHQKKSWVYAAASSSHSDLTLLTLPFPRAVEACVVEELERSNLETIAERAIPATAQIFGALVAKPEHTRVVARVRYAFPRRCWAMTVSAISRNWWALLAVLALALVAVPAYPQVTLTGAIQFSTNSTGAAYGGLLWNTLGDDSYYDLWLALNANATSPVNGPADLDAGISLTLEAGNTYKYYIFGQPGPGLITGFNGLNLFFEGNNSTPGISAHSATNGANFLPNAGSTLTLEGSPAAGSGTTAYGSGDVVVVLTDYNWNLPATPPGDVCQAFTFTPGDEADYFGSFTLQVFPAAALSASQTGGPPGTKITTTGSGFAPSETVNLYVNHIGGQPLITTTADASGAFTISVLEPQIAYGPIEIYAVGATSGKLGAASYFVSAALDVAPHEGLPGDSVTATAQGFGAGETIAIYWENPRQLLGTATANPHGTGSLKITIPADAPGGLNAVIGIGETTQATAYSKVQVK